MSTSPIKVLLVNASGRRTGSRSRGLAAEFIDRLRENGRDLKVTHRDLAEGVPLVDEAWITANFTAPENRTAAQAATLSYSDALVAEVKDADIIVIGAPVYNFSVPAALKAWIDQIARARLTFQYTDKGPVGLLTGKRAVIVTASGGTPAGADYDFATGYLRHILGFMGIKDVSFIAADQLLLDAAGAEARSKKSLEAALQAVSAPLAEAA